MVLRFPLIVWVAEFLTEDRYSGMATASRMPRISTTTSSSMRVKAARRLLRAELRRRMNMMRDTPVFANDADAGGSGGPHRGAGRRDPFSLPAGFQGVREIGRA